MAVITASSFPLEGICCSTSSGNTNFVHRPPFDSQRTSDLFGVSFRCKTPFLGSTQFHWLMVGHDPCLSKVCVAADYSDSVPNSSSYMRDQGYHPLEELKACQNVQRTKLSSAEIARTTVEANSNALLVFPGTVHSEPHEQISWGEFQYLIDDYGDIFLEISDEENILEDRGATNPVSALIGMDIPVYKNRRIGADYDILNSGNIVGPALDDGYFEIPESEVLSFPVDWGMPDASSLVHPLYFAKCLIKAVNMKCDKKMDHPSNGVSIVGFLRPAFADEETYLRRLYHSDDSDGYYSDRKEGEILRSNSMTDHRKSGLYLYRLEIMKIELLSVYGCQQEISLQEFLDAEPDLLAHSTSRILEHFRGRYDVALQALCKKKGLDVQGATLIGIDSLGVDVRVFSGVEVKTYRFPFKVQATSERAAEKQIQQLLFPRSQRKRIPNSWRQGQECVPVRKE